MTTVVNIRHRPSVLQDDPQSVYIGRAGKGMDGYFGNPYHLKPGETRGATIERFRQYAVERIATDPEFARRVRDLRGKTLVCFCKPASCHGDVLAELAEAPSAEQGGEGEEARALREAQKYAPSDAEREQLDASLGFDWESEGPAS